MSKNGTIGRNSVYARLAAEADMSPTETAILEGKTTNNNSSSDILTQTIGYRPKLHSIRARLENQSLSKGSINANSIVNLLNPKRNVPQNDDLKSNNNINTNSNIETNTNIDTNSNIETKSVSKKKDVIEPTMLVELKSIKTNNKISTSLAAENEIALAKVTESSSSLTDEEILSPLAKKLQNLDKNMTISAKKVRKISTTQEQNSFSTFTNNAAKSRTPNISSLFAKEKTTENVQPKEHVPDFVKNIFKANNDEIKSNESTNKNIDMVNKYSNSFNSSVKSLDKSPSKVSSDNICSFDKNPFLAADKKAGGTTTRNFVIPSNINNTTSSLVSRASTRARPSLFSSSIFENSAPKVVEENAVSSDIEPKKMEDIKKIVEEKEELDVAKPMENIQMNAPKSTVSKSKCYETLFNEKAWNQNTQQVSKLDLKTNFKNKMDVVKEESELFDESELSPRFTKVRDSIVLTEKRSISPVSNTRNSFTNIPSCSSPVLNKIVSSPLSKPKEERILKEEQEKLILEDSIHNSLSDVTKIEKMDNTTIIPSFDEYYKKNHVDDEEKEENEEKDSENKISFEPLISTTLPDIESALPIVSLQDDFSLMDDFTSILGSFGIKSNKETSKVQSSNHNKSYMSPRLGIVADKSPLASKQVSNETILSPIKVVESEVKNAFTASTPITEIPTSTKLKSIVEESFNEKKIEEIIKVSSNTKDIKPVVVSAPVLPPRVRQPSTNSVKTSPSLTNIVHRKPLPIPSPSPASLEKQKVSSEASEVASVVTQKQTLAVNIDSKQNFPSKKDKTPHISHLSPAESTESIGKSNEPKSSIGDPLAKATAYAAALASLITPASSKTELVTPTSPLNKQNLDTVPSNTVTLLAGADTPNISFSEPTSSLNSPDRNGLKSVLKRPESVHNSPIRSSNRIESKSVRFGYAWKDELEQRKTIENEDDDLHVSNIHGISGLSSDPTTPIGYLYNQVICVSGLPFSAAKNCPCMVEVRLLQGGRVIDDFDTILEPGSNELDIGFNSTIQLRGDSPLCVQIVFNDLMMTIPNSKSSGTIRGGKSKYSTLSKVTNMFGMKRSSTSGAISAEASAMEYLENPLKPVTLTAESFLKFEDYLGELIRMVPTTTDSYISEHSLNFRESLLLEVAGAQSSSAIMVFEASYLPFIKTIGLTSSVLPSTWPELQNTWGIVEWNRASVIKGGLWQLGGDCPEWTYRQCNLIGTSIYYDDIDSIKDARFTKEHSISLRQLENIVHYEPKNHCRNFSSGLFKGKTISELQNSQPSGVRAKKPFRISQRIKSAKAVNPPILDQYGADTTAFVLLFKDGREIAFRTDRSSYALSERWRKKIMQGEATYDTSMEIELDSQDLAYVWISCVKDVIGKPSIPEWWLKLEHQAGVRNNL